MMIQAEDLFKLGYRKKQESNLGKKLSIDFRFRNPGDRDYLLNLSEDGTVTIVYPINSKKNQLFFKDLNEFTRWHNEYQQD